MTQFGIIGGQLPESLAPSRSQRIWPWLTAATSQVSFGFHLPKRFQIPTSGLIDNKISESRSRRVWRPSIYCYRCGSSRSFGKRRFLPLEIMKQLMTGERILKLSPRQTANEAVQASCCLEAAFLDHSEAGRIMLFALVP